MQQEDLNRFLQTVRRTRLVDYLELSPGETAEQALQRRLRWAARSKNSAKHAAEAAFLLQHGDALRAHLAESEADAVEDEWIEFGDDDPDSEYGKVGLYSSSTARESIDLDEILGGPTDAPPARGDEDELPPDRMPTAPAAAARGLRPAITSRGRSPTPLPSDRGRSPAGSRQRTPSVLLERAKRNSPVPHLGRIPTSRPRAASASPSPPLLARRPNDSARSGSPRPAPRSWSAGQGPSRLATPGAVTPRPSSYSTPAGASRGSNLRVPSPAPATPRAPTPGGYDVQITGQASFVRNNDQYGTSEVVYESELYGGGGQLRTPMPARTPHSSTFRSAEPNQGDILGSLRGNVRKGSSGAPANAIAKKPQGIPVWVYLIPITALVSIICFYIVGISWGFIANPLAAPPPEQTGEAGDAFDVGGRLAPVAVEQPDAVVTDTDAAPTTPPEDGAGSGSGDSGSGSGAGGSESGASGSGSGASGSGSGASGSGSGASGSGSGASGSSSGASGSSSGASGSGGNSGAGRASDPSGSSGDGGSSGGSGSQDATDSGSGGSDGASEGSDAGSDTETSSQEGAGSGDGAAEDASGEGSTDPVEPPPPPPPPKGVMAGAWKCAIGDGGCVADLTQRGESVRGTITINAEQIQVSGRYNGVKRSIYLTGTGDSNIVFRGSVDGDQVNGKAKLGAGKLYQVWQLRRN